MIDKKKIEEAARVYSQEHQYTEGVMGLEVCIQEETLPVFAGLKKAISASIFDDVTKKELVEFLSKAMSLEIEFSEHIQNFVACWEEKYQEEFDEL